MSVPTLGCQPHERKSLTLSRISFACSLPNLHICVTSRPEIDIQTMLKPLAVNAISLHDESGQKIVIANYVSSVVSSDERMRQWRDEDKKLVVKELSEERTECKCTSPYSSDKSHLIFRVGSNGYSVNSRLCGTQSNQMYERILEKLPKTLDETYERVLKNINENNREHARRLLHCLAVSVRPLRVEELAEILTFDFDAAEEGIPKFHPDRRPRTKRRLCLSICSSLITIVDNRGSRVVQFSHFSVKEFLTSNHLASSTGQLTSYHILPGPRAHHPRAGLSRTSSPFGR